MLTHTHTHARARAPSHTHTHTHTSHTRAQQAEMAEESNESRVEDIVSTFEIHIGVGAGPGTVSIVGVPGQCLEVLVYGDPLQAMGDAEGAAERGEMCIAANMWKLVQDDTTLTGIPRVEESCYLVTQILPTHKISARVQARVLEMEREEKARAALEVSDGKDSKEDEEEKAATEDPALAKARLIGPRRLKDQVAWMKRGGIQQLGQFLGSIQAFLPGPALASLRSADMVKQKLEPGNLLFPAGSFGELRNITVLFCNFLEVPANAQLVLQTGVALIKDVGAMLRQFVVDDKGCVLISCLGVPKHTHPDDPTRGVKLALALVESMKAIGSTVSVGITTGNAYCGDIGVAYRREYAVVGDTVRSSL